MTAPPACYRIPAFLHFPVLLLCLACMALTAVPARAQGNYTLTYVTRPGEYLLDVVRRTETSGPVVRELNPGKIGPDGRLEPYTRLLIPTSRANSGKVIGATVPKGVKPAPRAPFVKPIVPATPQSAPPPDDKPVTSPAEESPSPTYDTRPSSFEYKPEIGPSTYIQPVVALAAIIAGIYVFMRIVKRRGWESRLSGKRNSQPPEVKPDAPAPAEQPSFGAHLNAATEAREAPEEIPEKSPAEISSVALLEREEKTNTLNRVEVAEPDPVALEKSLTDTQEMPPPDFSNYVDEFIPQTSLADALRGRRKHS